MEKPNVKDYQYSNGEMRDLVAYTEALEQYVKHLETKDKNLTISDVSLSGPPPEGSEPFQMPQVEIKIGHAHQCERIATAPAMGEGREFWVGKLKKPIGLETHCLHLKTGMKDITFLCNEADFRQLQIICRAVTGQINESWMQTMLKLAGAEANQA